MIKEIAKRSSLYFFWMVIAKISSTGAFLLFGRILGAKEFGSFLYFLTVIQIMTVFSDMGVTYWQQTQEDHRSAFAQAFRLRMLTLCCSVGVILLYSVVFSVWDIGVISLLCIALVFDALLAISDGYFLSAHKGHVLSYKILSKTAITLIVFFLLPGKSSTSALIAYIVGNALTVLWSVPWNILYLDRKKEKVLRTFQQTKPYALLIVTSFTYARADSFLVGSMLGSVALRNYGAAYRYLEGVSMLPTAIGQVLFPLSAKNKRIDWSFLIPLIFISTVVGICVGVLLYFFAPLLTVGILGSSYLVAESVLIVFSIVSVLFFVNAPLATVIQSSSRFGEFLPFGIANTMWNVIANLILISKLGVMGAAYAMLLSELTGLGINLFFIRKVLKKSNV
jgi:O-antigen/teichoic acid export membrane protein